MPVRTDQEPNGSDQEPQPPEEMQRLFEEIREFGQPLEDGCNGARFFFDGIHVSYYPQQPPNLSYPNDAEERWKTYRQTAEEARVYPEAPISGMHTQGEIEVFKIGRVFCVRLKIDRISDSKHNRPELTSVVPWQKADMPQKATLMQNLSPQHHLAQIYTRDWDDGRWSFHIDKARQRELQARAANRR